MGERLGRNPDRGVRRGRNPDRVPAELVGQIRERQLPRPRQVVGAGLADPIVAAVRAAATSSWWTS